MNRYHLVGVAVLAMLCSAGPAGPANADGMPAKRTAAPAPAAPASNWTGGQFGAFGGGSNLAQNFAEPGSHLCPTTGLGTLQPTCVESHLLFSGHPTSFTAGAFLGYRVQFGTYVVGIEGDGAWKRASDSGYLAVSSVDSGFIRNEVFTGTLRQGWDGSVRGRAGVLVTPTTLAYATAGVAFGEVCGSFSYTASLISAPAFTVATASGAGSWCDTRVGYTAGAGLEAEIHKGVKARIEYRYTDLGDFSKSVPLTATGPCGGSFACTGAALIDLEAAFHTIRVGLGVDF